jgi:hypothetical protein
MVLRYAHLSLDRLSMEVATVVRTPPKSRKKRLVPESAMSDTAVDSP